MKFLIAFGISILLVAPAAADEACCGKDTVAAAPRDILPQDRTIVLHPDSTIMNETALPAFALTTPGFQRAYQIVADSPVLIAHFPCVCGCMRNRGHTSLLSCYRKSDGSWDDHATVCQECIDGALLIGWWRAKYNWTFEEMRPVYEEKFHPEKWPMIVITERADR